MNVSFSAHAEAFLVERQTVAVDVVLFMWVLYTSSLKEFLIVLWCLVRHKNHSRLSLSLSVKASPRVKFLLW